MFSWSHITFYECGKEVSQGGSGGPLISNIHFMYIELWDATGHHPKGLVAVGCSLDGGDQGSLSFFLTQITDLNYWPLIRCMKLVLR